ncbi:MAG: sporulation integral membrane protein YtvI [Bacilli bacterium]
MNHPFIMRTFRLAFIVFVVVFGLWATKQIWFLTYPFVFAFLLALVINPIVNFLTNRFKFPRALSVLVSLLLILTLIVSGALFLVNETIAGLNYLIKVVPENYQKIMDFAFDYINTNIQPLILKVENLYSSLDISHQKTIIDQFQAIGDDFVAMGKTLLTNSLTFMTTLIGAFPTLLTVLIFSTLGTFFISKDWYTIRARVKEIVPETVSRGAHDMLGGLKIALGGYVKSQFTLIGMTFLLILVGLYILGVPYALTIALILALLDLLPIVGTVIVFLPWMLFEFFFGSPTLGIGLGVLYVVTLVQRQIAEPKILSSNIGVNPLATLIALFAGYQLLGFFGLILGPASLVLLNTMVQVGLFARLKAFIMGTES